MEHKNWRFLAFSGALAVGLGTLVGHYLAAETWTPGSIGFPLLLSIPGIWLLTRAAGRAATTVSVAALALAAALIGLDVVDSARTEVVLVGWFVALASVVALLALVAAVTGEPKSAVTGVRSR